MTSRESAIVETLSTEANFLVVDRISGLTVNAGEKFLATKTSFE
jgi:hypothetical protein